MSKESRQLILLLILVTIGLSYSYYTYLFAPKWTEIQGLQHYIEERQSRYTSLLGYQERSSSLQREVAQLETKYNTLRNQIPQKIDKPKLVVDLYTVAKMNQVQPQAVTFESLEAIDSYVTQSLTFTCLGNRQGIINMINDIQRSEGQRFNLESMNFTNDKGILHGEIHLIAYAGKAGEEQPQTENAQSR
ncbi:Tfp pilus assembly protein PilO [Desulfitobacterium dichloroeliminans LMG P-21439]|uniref:Tfp pilus assembly protein PilO n=1 Tax=Desulfitobacterium dichloroeliminans (strain LMG P-21439 / DCA1) TaxID=871963 RepID=L0FB57_DESDL|nr:type 4a pilus biogenesis protein PilO [Desulfitobacterium dichloroeliminans]AGA69891.1 Tfp pilus assembly protein PilO [Desulfitobacterium dichloroeliminans LMG P-21439]